MALCVLLSAPAFGFDTHWHMVCIQSVGERYGFAETAWKIMQLGDFSPDFFGPIAEYVSNNPLTKELDSVRQYQADKAEVRGAAIFLHFDNLNSDFKSNSNFDYILRHLLERTQALIAGYNDLDVDDRVRRTLTLVTLGASLHAVQDFYSHSDWVHNDFDKTDVRMARLPSGDLRAPTWFEFRAKHSDPSAWPFQVQTGIYPPVPGARNTHTHMNHDNSQLMYTEVENPGAPLKSQAEYHNAGAVAARGDAESNLTHQQLAVNTAIAASIEWFTKVESDTGARKAIEFAKEWNLRLHDPRLAKELEAGLMTQMALSCAAGKWDGDNPPGERGALCRSMLARTMNSAGRSGSQLESEVIGLAANLLMPAALRFTGMFWDVHAQYHILERLAEDIGTDSGHYGFTRQ